MLVLQPLHPQHQRRNAQTSREWEALVPRGRPQLELVRRHDTTIFVWEDAKRVRRGVGCEPRADRTQHQAEELAMRGGRHGERLVGCVVTDAPKNVGREFQTVELGNGIAQVLAITMGACAGYDAVPNSTCIVEIGCEKYSAVVMIWPLTPP